MQTDYSKHSILNIHNLKTLFGVDKSRAYELKHVILRELNVDNVTVSSIAYYLNTSEKLVIAGLYLQKRIVIKTYDIKHLFGIEDTQGTNEANRIRKEYNIHISKPITIEHFSKWRNEPIIMVFTYIDHSKNEKLFEKAYNVGFEKIEKIKPFLKNKMNDIFKEPYKKFNKIYDEDYIKNLDCQSQIEMYLVPALLTIVKLFYPGDEFINYLTKIPE